MDLMNILINTMIIAGIILICIVVGVAIYSIYIVTFRLKKEFIRYGDRYVLRFRDKKTGQFK